MGVPGVTMEQILVRVLAVHVCYVLQAELVELDALHSHTVNYLPGSYVNQYFLRSGVSYVGLIQGTNKRKARKRQSTTQTQQLHEERDDRFHTIIRQRSLLQFSRH